VGCDLSLGSIELGRASARGRRRGGHFAGGWDVATKGGVESGGVDEAGGWMDGDNRRSEVESFVLASGYLG
jgi:hypothetical protein